MIEGPPQALLPSVGYPMIWSSCIAANLALLMSARAPRFYSALARAVEGAKPL